MGMNFENDTPHSLYNELVSIEDAILACGKRMIDLEKRAATAEADYEQKKSTYLIQMFAEEAGDEEKKIKPFKRTEAQREAIYRSMYAKERLERNLAKGELNAEKALQRALSDKLSSMQSRKGIMMDERDRFSTNGQRVPAPAAHTYRVDPPAPAMVPARPVDQETAKSFTAPPHWNPMGGGTAQESGVRGIQSAPDPFTAPAQEPATGGELSYDFGVDKRTQESVMRQVDEEIAAAQLPVPQAIVQEAFPAEPVAELKEIYGRKAEPWDDDSPIAKTISDLLSAKQLGMIRALARENHLNADEECMDVFSCKTEELSKKAASKFIQHLQDTKPAWDRV